MNSCLGRILLIALPIVLIIQFKAWRLTILLLLVLLFKALSDIAKTTLRSKLNNRSLAHRTFIYLISPVPVMALYSTLAYLHHYFGSAFLLGTFFSYVPLSLSEFIRIVGSEIFPLPRDLVKKRALK